MRLPSVNLRRRLRCLCLFLLCAFAALHPLDARAEGNLLTGRSPSRSQGVSNVKVLTDGIRAAEGEDWQSTAAAVFESDRAFVEYDLGSSVNIVAGYLQGDNNDEYSIGISEDRAEFKPLWAAGPREGAGLRERWSDALSGKGRYVRLSVRGGDRAYSSTELQLFSEKPSTLPPQLPRAGGESQAGRVRSLLLYFVLAFGVMLFSTHSRHKAGRLLAPALLPVVAGWLAYQAIDGGWPLANREVAFVRAAAAAIALLAVIRYSIKRWPAHRSMVTAALLTSTVMASAAFYNLGRPQFWNHAEARPEFVHTYDMRVYQPFARFFKELQYDGVYPASVLAFAEDKRGGQLETLARTEVRSLKDHRARRVGEMTEEIKEVRSRFTPERWQELRRDMLYFEDVMGPEFLGTLLDHGANATPVWVFFARLFLGHSPATENLLTLSGLVDALLLLGLLVAMWRSFGLWPALLAATVFGANDLYMFGTNWTGATLRHDWLALLGFGVCALKKEKWVLAGACLGLSAMIRAFPAAALVGVSLPWLWAIGEQWARDGKLPGPKQWPTLHPAAFRVVLAALGTMLAAFLLTSALYGFEAWGNWWHKVTLLNRDVGVNEVSLRALVAGADNNAGRTLAARRAIHVGAVIACIALVAIAARRRPLYQAMLFSLPLIIVIWNPSNYYSHFVFLLALLGTLTPRRKASEEQEAEPAPGAALPLQLPLLSVAGPLLGLCLAGYWSSLDPDLERHFQDSTVMLLVTLGFLFFHALKRDPAVREALAR